MMTVEIVKRIKVKKIDLNKADAVKQEVYSRDEVMHVEKNDLWFSTKAGWRASKNDNRGSTT